MCLRATQRAKSVQAVLFLLSCATSVLAQTPDQRQADWRHIGNSAIELSLPSAATGPVDRVWYSSDGSILYARTGFGRIFQTADLETWKPVTDASIAPPPEADSVAPNSPEPGARLRQRAAKMYSYARNAFRSDDDGATWINLTSYKGSSILGAPLADFAVSPSNPEDITGANAAGVWHSADSGLSWIGLNSALPNLPIRRIFTLPSGLSGVKIGMGIPGAPELEWAPGEKTSWRVSDSTELEKEDELKQFATQALHANITAVATSGDAIYAGSADGNLWVSLDKGVNWNPWATIEAGPVEAIYADPKNPSAAIAVFGAHPKQLSPGVQPVHVMRTMNAGLFWDPTTANLPDVAAHGVVADRASGSVYVATDAGVFYTTIDLASAGRPSSWNLVSNGLPSAPAMDVKLDSAANNLYVALQGYGVYGTIAPHRFRDFKVVNAADFSSRPAAPGSLLSILGARVTSARSGDTSIPVLATDGTGSQIQVPFDASGQSLALALESSAGSLVTGFPLKSVSPAIFVDPDGTPMLLDGDSGVMLDASKPAHSGSRIQVLATGLGRVDPDWPTGTPGPTADPPHVVASVQAYLDQTPVEVSRAVLAPYVGFYLIEIQLPRIVNAGPAELYIEAEGQPSNRVRLYIEP